VRGVHSALKDEILDQPSDQVLSEHSDGTGLQTEASAQPTRDVVFATATQQRSLAAGELLEHA